MMRHRKDIVSGTVLGLCAVVYLLLTSQIKVFRGPGATPLDARFVPRMWGAALLILSVLLVARGLRGAKKAGERRGEAEKGSLKRFSLDHYEVILSFAALFVYILFLKSVGFLIMSCLYIFAQALILTKPGGRRPITALALGVAASILIDFVFVRLLFVMLPRGVLGF